MACHVEDWGPPFGQVIMCGSAFRKRRKCAHCGCPDAKALCDWPLGNGKTCDKPCCFRCRRHVAANVDYCRDHWGEGARADAVQRGLFE